MKNGERKFDGIEFINKRGFYVDPWRAKMKLTEGYLHNKIVLDAGCGPGLTANRFSRIAGKIFGMDISRELVGRAKQKSGAGNLWFGVGSVESIPFKDAFFDVVYSHWVIEHLERPEQFIDEARRVLKPGGILILWVPNVWNVAGFLAKTVPISVKVKALKVLFRSDDVSPHRCYYRANSVRELDRLCKGRFTRRHLERFDDIDYYRNFRVLTCVWLLKHKLTNNRLLRWTYPHFHVEYEKC